MDSNQQPNNRVAIVFEETLNEEEGYTFLNIYLEKEGRDIDPDLIAKGEPTHAEMWGHEMLGFIEDYLKIQLKSGEMKGYLLAMPKKKDMN